MELGRLALGALTQSLAQGEPLEGRFDPCSSAYSVQTEKASAKMPQLRLSQRRTPASQAAGMTLTQLLRELDAARKVNKSLKQRRSSCSVGCL